MLFRTWISNIMIYAESAPQFLIPRNYSDDINKLPLIQKLFYISFKLANAINSRREKNLSRHNELSILCTRVPMAIEWAMNLIERLNEWMGKRKRKRDELETKCSHIANAAMTFACVALLTPTNSPVCHKIYICQNESTRPSLQINRKRKYILHE